MPKSCFWIQGFMVAAGCSPHAALLLWLLEPSSLTSKGAGLASPASRSCDGAFWATAVRNSEEFAQVVLLMGRERRSAALHCGNQTGPVWQPNLKQKVWPRPWPQLSSNPGSVSPGSPSSMLGTMCPLVLSGLSSITWSRA